MALAFTMFAAGCSTPLRDIGRAPDMSQVGSGLRSKVDKRVLDPTAYGAGSGNRLWDLYGQSLYRDLRAHRVGDVVTIDISIDEKATLGNESGRSKEAKVSNSLEYLAALLGLQSSGKGSLNVQSQSTTTGKGNVVRSEKIKFSIAATVVRKLPDGGLLVSGSQEIRVNFELRVLQVQGIVKPQDISKENRISYDRIAEARISYGGRGRIMEVQQPQLGQQLYDLVRPF
ncbi:MAG: flagellar basal body L-ring protein FlgH [Hyphomicrobiales bacterium]|nr:flagellar basal body L-ring protein FlgH [Hyphomicrobiales bacterium]